MDDQERNRLIGKLQRKFGGYFGSCPSYPWEEWRDAVAADETRLGYWEWVANMSATGDPDARPIYD